MSFTGGGVALLHASNELDKLQTTSLGGKIGVQLLQQALKMPVCTIASAAGVDGSVVAEKLQEQDNPDVGYDPATGEYVDVIKLGIIDPLKLIIKEIDDAISYFITHCWCSYEMLQRQKGNMDGMGGS